MLLKRARLTLVAILFLVALRFTIGYHFYMEGVSKVKDGNFSSTGFLSAAKGPLADKFHQLIPDFDGKFRLPELRSDMEDEADKKPSGVDSNRLLSYKRLFAHLDTYVDNTASQFGFTEEQKSEATNRLTEAKKRLVLTIDESSDKIQEYLAGFGRIEANKQDEMRNNVAGMRKQKEEIESKWRALVAPTLREVDKVLLNLEEDVNALATEEQVGEKKLSVPLRMPDAGPIDVRMVDKYIPIFDMVVGILLMIGLLTPLAGLAAGIFLASVILTQFPGYPGAQPTYYQAIEMLGCFLLVFTDAGRYAGLDFIPWAFWNRNRRATEE